MRPWKKKKQLYQLCSCNSRSREGKAEALKGRAGMSVESGQSCVKLRKAGRVKVIRPRILPDEDEMKSKDRSRETSDRS